jgi:hypothetical protein
MGAPHAGFACGGFGPLFPRVLSATESIVKNPASPQ